MLLDEFWTTRFLPYCTATLRECTVIGYESAWRLHVAPTLGGMSMEDITVDTVDEWIAGLSSAGVARKAWTLLRAMLRRAIRWGLLDVDITRRQIRLPQSRRYEPLLLTLRQQRIQLRGFYDAPLEAWHNCSMVFPVERT